MRSLLRKDLYLLAQSSRSAVLVLAFLALIQVYSIGVEGFVAFAAIYSGMLVISTFAYDERAHWMRTAFTMPFSRREVVAAKYGLLLLLSVAGAVVGTVGGGALGLLFDRWSLTPEAVVQLGLMALVGLSVTVCVIGTTIPLLFRYGAEKGRLWLLLALLVPAALVAGAYSLLQALGIAVTEQLVQGLLLMTPVLAAIWTAVTYTVSCKIIEKMDV